MHWGASHIDLSLGYQSDYDKCNTVNIQEMCVQGLKRENRGVLKILAICDVQEIGKQTKLSLGATERWVE